LSSADIKLRLSGGLRKNSNFTWYQSFRKRKVKMLFLYRQWA